MGGASRNSFSHDRERPPDVKPLPLMLAISRTTDENDGDPAGHPFRQRHRLWPAIQLGRHFSSGGSLDANYHAIATRRLRGERNRRFQAATRRNLLRCSEVLRVTPRTCALCGDPATPRPSAISTDRPSRPARGVSRSAGPRSHEPVSASLRLIPPKVRDRATSHPARACDADRRRQFEARAPTVSAGDSGMRQGSLAT